MTKRFFAPLLLAAALAACSGTTPRPTPPEHATASAPVTLTIAERYVSEEHPQDELDSLATWTAPDGRTWLIATAKSAHQLVVFDADSGQRLRALGGKGSARGQFNRPNGIAVYGDNLFVVERDNHRVQVLSLPALSTVATFGEDVLRSPYGLWINPVAPDTLDVYVTDNFMYGPRFEQVPPLTELAQRVRRFRLDLAADGMLHARATDAFGGTHEPGALHVVESIAGDAENDRLMIADEANARAGEPQPSTLFEYSLDGAYRGRSLPSASFQAQAEGVALWSCSGGAGYWIAVDQLAPLTVFHLFDRRTLAPAGSFQGSTTAHTDGIALHAASTASFPAGALFAVHDDKAVTAFDLRDVAQKLALDPACTR